MVATRVPGVFTGWGPEPLSMVKTTIGDRVSRHVIGDIYIQKDGKIPGDANSWRTASTAHDNIAGSFRNALGSHNDRHSDRLTSQNRLGLQETEDTTSNEKKAKIAQRAGHTLHLPLKLV